MKLKVFSVYDSKAAAYMQPFFSINDAMAIRAFADVVRDTSHTIGRHPADYSLFAIGSFDDAHAELVAQDRECIVTALELVSRHAPGFEADQRELSLKVAS